MWHIGHFTGSLPYYFKRELLLRYRENFVCQEKNIYNGVMHAVFCKSKQLPLFYLDYIPGKSGSFMGCR